MKIGLFGYGKMGKMVEQAALKEGHTVCDVQEAEVCVDFSHADVVLKHVAWAAAVKKPIIIGTTGWEKELGAAQVVITQGGGTAALFSPNFALGMAHFIHLLKQAHALFQGYDCAGVEYHHKQKKDAPSGTAKMMARILGMLTPFTSVRCGNITGKHEVIFDSPYDTITLIHEAHNREAMARGALRAAEWIVDKKGWYTLDDMLSSSHNSIR
jgi:4-hydroxy-tetrahydrodipicolinate reductase